MKGKFIPLIEKQKLHNGYRHVFEVKSMKLLLIQEANKMHLLVNKCGHFGVSLEGAQIQEHLDNDIIICNQHGISFDLSTGKVVNRPWEECDPISILEPIIKEDMIGFYL